MTMTALLRGRSACVRATATWLRPQETRALSTVVTDEVSKFNRVSDDWWSPKSTSGVGPLHQLNPVRVKYIRSHVIEQFGGSDDDGLPLRDLRVVDVGCGGGILSEALCRIGANMISVDPGVDNIEAAKRHAQRHEVTHTIDYRCCTSDDLVAAGEQFDVVCSLEVIEHVSDPKAFIQSLTPLVKPGGLLFLSTINRTLLSGALAIGMAEYVMRIVPPGTHDWNKFLEPHEITRVLKQENMTVKDVSGIVGNPILRDWRIDPNCKAINYILCAAKPAE
ncbi:hypothetical protein Poli38472_005595 [Pythium oligandrum]|uniref:Ubiquinone biosynthesis O-methyltransferase, mitochondrial n=1 Tax=Pythium oligandrum TaxID=41045 RepID=A0A8K1CGK4_PYTOL|nr:hypothetical protein Poli38472_005595 [Pythium oligandrum]|eukprot:TMW62977.1 hypothetical protein Poli38472_005595 [Pythium oligandrum]